MIGRVGHNAIKTRLEVLRELLEGEVLEEGRHELGAAFFLLRRTANNGVNSAPNKQCKTGTRLQRKSADGGSSQARADLSHERRHNLGHQTGARRDVERQRLVKVAVQQHEHGVRVRQAATQDELNSAGRGSSSGKQQRRHTDKPEADGVKQQRTMQPDRRAAAVATGGSQTTTTKSATHHRCMATQTISSMRCVLPRCAPSCWYTKSAHCTQVLA